MSSDTGISLQYGAENDKKFPKLCDTNFSCCIVLYDAVQNHLGPTRSITTCRDSNRALCLKLASFDKACVLAKNAEFICYTVLSNTA